MTKGQQQLLERYGHGGDLTTASEVYGRDAGQFLDFSANMNPFGPPPSIAAVLRQYAEHIQRYPDPAVRQLRAELGRMHRVDPDALLVGNGAAELIDLTFRVLRPSVTVLAVPCFNEYADAALKSGSQLRTIALTPDNHFQLRPEQLKQMLAALKEDGFAAGDALWFFGSPNNPTGQLVAPELIRDLLQAGERVVLDEAFMEFIPEAASCSLLAEAAGSRQLIVIRSLTKFYAIPGIRLGYMAAHPDLIKELWDLQIPWSVNSLAQQIGAAVLNERDYEARTIAWLAQKRPQLAGQLQALGLQVYQGKANYILLSIPLEMNLTATQLQQALGRRGILIRDASLFDGLDQTYCRVAVRSEAENALLITALADVLEERR
ncbi:threonine-phosphate decarboxylase CobD [Paenibacillus sp. GCM10027626]|uniref:threonine-phosphate decarboxylase CobD n=1 Tax=Paenibacillus sp. GCM10027626 TaxID=3273411 RepID=UPI003635FECB